MSHTPGPWFVSKQAPNASGKQWDVGLGGDDFYTCGVGPNGTYMRIGGICTEDDARLIAAAPDLLALHRKNLATLEWTIRRLVELDQPAGELDMAASETRDAIAKAEGKS